MSDRSQNNGHNDRQQGERYNKRSHNSYDDSPRSESDDRAGRRLELFCWSRRAFCLAKSTNCPSLLQDE